MIFATLIGAKAMSNPHVPEEFFPNGKCQKQFEAQLQKFFPKTQPQWSRVVDPHFNTRAFRAATDKIGEWHEVHSVEKSAPKAFFYTPTTITEFQWNKNCVLKKKSGPGIEFFPKDTAKSEAFKDSDLANILKTQKSGVIYLWSPRMVYSVTEFNRVRELAKSKNLEFIPVYDNNVTPSDASAALKAGGVDIPSRGLASADLYRRLQSVDLYMRNGTLHFPTIFVFGKGQVHPRRLVGVLNSHDLGLAIDEWQKELQ